MNENPQDDSLETVKECYEKLQDLLQNTQYNISRENSGIQK